MLTAILARFWPVLIPIVVYLIWHDSQRRKALKTGDVPRKLNEGPWLLSLGATVLIAIGCIAWFGVSTPSNTNVGYSPAHMVDGKLVKGKMIEK